MSHHLSTHGREPCPSCGVVLDVGPEALFALVRCPRCLDEVRVRCRLGPYQLNGVLGEGGSGRVFRARKWDEREGGTDVALKVLEKSIPAYKEHLLLLRNEALSARLAEHPRVVRVMGLEESGEGAWLEMELMDGGSLHDKIVSESPFLEEEVLRIGLQILKALASAQTKGITHRDLKPANILFTMEGGAKLGDFGLARSSAAKPVAQSHLLATPDYVSPEMLAGFHGDFHSDLYSLGGCLFHALAGTPPYGTEGLDLPALQALKAKAATLPKKSCSVRTRSLVARMMAPVPALRFHSYEELERELLAILETFDREIHGPRNKRKKGILGGFFPTWRNDAKS